MYLFLEKFVRIFRKLSEICEKMLKKVKKFWKNLRNLQLLVKFFWEF